MVDPLLEVLLRPLAAPEFQVTRSQLTTVWGSTESLPEQDRALVAMAMEWAIHCHREQRPRPNGVPYLEHVSQVALSITRWAEARATLLAIALLHDAVEDQSAALAKRCLDAAISGQEERAFRAVRDAFGAAVEVPLRLLTNPDFSHLLTTEHGFSKGTPEYDAGLCALYALHFAEVFAHDGDAALVKLADFCDNALRVESLRLSAPDVYRWLRRKYSAPLVFLSETLQRAEAGSALERAAGEVLPRIEAALRATVS